MAVALMFQIGDHINIIGFKLPTLPKRVKPRKPSIWQRVKQAAYNLALGLMPSPMAFA